MSLKTRCPACDTVFKIVPDQLKVSSGWVRCGRCAEVFDAASPAAETVITSTVDIAKNIATSSTNKTSTISLSPSKKQNTDLSFVRTAKNKAFWQQKSVVTTLRAACVGFIGLLSFQLVFNQRNHLAASYPTMKPTFESMCLKVGCTIAPYKNIDALKIDSSSFQKSQRNSIDALQDENFVLKLSVKNNSELAIAMPAVELTLTDTNDKAVLRRVITSNELGFSSDTLAANSDWSSSLNVAVKPSSTQVSFSGYRVLLFYP